MPLFFFHYYTPERVSFDDVGCQFESLEHAYSDAYRSAVDLGAEMLKAHCNPASHRIVITDCDGVVMMELPFDEIFGRARGKPMKPTDVHTAQRQRLLGQMAAAKILRDEIAGVCLAARDNVARAHEVLRRARAA